MTMATIKAMEIIRNVSAWPDPVAAMRALEAEATEEERRITFPRLWVSLWRAMGYPDMRNDHP